MTNAPTIAVDVAIMGAGPVGGALACRLATAGLRVAVIDRAPLPPMEHPAYDGRAYAISAAMRPLLDQAGVWDKLPDPTCPILDIRVSDGRVGRRASRLFLHFDHTEAGDTPFGWMVEARSLRRALNAHLHALPDLHVFAPVSTEVVRSDDAAEIRIDGGPVLRCQLVIGAEGRQSSLRQSAGIGVARIPYGQTGMVCAISHELPHNGVALEHFLPGGPFAVLPMPASPDAIPGGAPHVSAVVWTERTKVAETILRLDDARFATEIRRRIGDYLGTVRPIGRRWSYPLSAMLVQRYTDTRLALAGDAAHGIHPIAGQGLNLGFRDATALAGLLIEAHEAGEDLGAPALLARYQRARRGDNLTMLAATDALDRLFSSDRPAVRLARDLGIAAVHRTPALKRFFMRSAMGLHAAGAE
ncbi:MAG TPA: UbiH/UbiF/VisC/COQ6 family ubiquinone biosynthesis hydroxylase [Rhodopila sp.]|uniref:UbiH/UbiF/VisC/COQ6 family ubiquinone biosynthesis hydroxylase n=1 Tax=Rhodopila sp. TaxID=2480087 RepID=UPI002BCC637F|nr:UbiH/UbiF/VisC/COQ6 family ubiquinone biosynthesis hydroxylase [Rhodopila sp.]HVY17954.1 UbiH/UbiF/VisC/COQ6 family ubiquinone biosynthesis hydroxylase [Rhodopila sp.]